MLRYLRDEHQAKKGEPLPGEWTTEEDPNTPQQRNGCDCGVFTCVNAEGLSVGKELRFGQREVTENARERIALAILEGKI